MVSLVIEGEAFFPSSAAPVAATEDWWCCNCVLFNICQNNGPQNSSGSAADTGLPPSRPVLIGHHTPTCTSNTNVSYWRIHCVGVSEGCYAIRPLINLSRSFKSIFSAHYTIYATKIVSLCLTQHSVNWTRPLSVFLLRIAKWHGTCQLFHTQFNFPFILFNDKMTLNNNKKLIKWKINSGEIADNANDTGIVTAFWKVIKILNIQLYIFIKFKFYLWIDWLTLLMFVISCLMLMVMFITVLCVFHFIHCIYIFLNFCILYCNRVWLILELKTYWLIDWLIDWLVFSAVDMHMFIYRYFWNPWNNCNWGHVKIR